MTRNKHFSHEGTHQLEMADVKSTNLNYVLKRQRSPIMICFRGNHDCSQGEVLTSHLEILVPGTGIPKMLIIQDGSLF